MTWVKGIDDKSVRDVFEGCPIRMAETMSSLTGVPRLLDDFSEVEEKGSDDPDATFLLTWPRSSTLRRLRSFDPFDSV